MRRSEVKRQVLEHINENIYVDIEQYVVNSTIQLWGIDQPKTFKKDILLLTLYKDIFGVGYHHVAERIKFEYKITDHSLRHNVSVMRPVLEEWAKGKISVGNVQSWKTAAHNSNFGKLVEDANLFMDSSDFRLQGKVSTSRKSDTWSYKCNSPGSRYMLIQGAATRILKVWGGYSPKIYDGDFLTINRSKIETLFDGGVIVADNHFSKGRKLFKNIKFYTNYKKQQQGKKRKRADPADDDLVANITREQEQFNKQHQSARARVEDPFGWIKRKFKCLGKPWMESQEQLDAMVLFACAVYNCTI